MRNRGSGQRTRLRSMSAIGWNGQNHRVAAPATMRKAVLRKAGTSPAPSAVTPQIAAPAAWAPNRTIW